MVVRDLPEALARSGSVFLDDARREGRSMLFSNPVREVRADSVSEVEHALNEADRVLGDGFWIAGYVSYEAGEAFVGAGGRRTEGPLIWLGVYESPEDDSLTSPPAPVTPRDDLQSNIALEPDIDDYLRMFSRVRHHIREGDVYQINLTGRARFEVDDPVRLYLALKGRQPVPYGAIIRTPATDIISFSPERFFRTEGRRILARPMKGTAPRGQTPDLDAQSGRRLAVDPKNRAENLMIVDLLRNDLSIVCEPGSVMVPSLFNVEAHPTLWQMTSDVEGELRPEVRLSDVFRALFPCGSITGAPKRRAMQIIRDIEPWPRGVYCGAIGFASPDGVAEFSVAIRTIEIHGRSAVMGTGSGIVWDSDPDSEYEEMLLKTRFLTFDR